MDSVKNKIHDKCWNDIHREVFNESIPSSNINEVPTPLHRHYIDIQKLVYIEVMLPVEAEFISEFIVADL